MKRTPPQISIGLFDANLPFNMSEMISGCGDPPFYFVMSASASPELSFEIKAEANVMDDQIGALLDQAPFDSSDTEMLASCSPETLALTRYKYFTARYDLEPSNGGGSLNDTCAGVDLRGPKPVVTIGGFLTMSTSTVFTQTSKHGTDTLQILTDEGSILGGVSFFAWFFSIFAI